MSLEVSSLLLQLTELLTADPSCCALLVALSRRCSGTPHGHLGSGLGPQQSTLVSRYAYGILQPAGHSVCMGMYSCNPCTSRNHLMQACWILHTSMQLIGCGLST